MKKISKDSTVMVMDNVVSCDLDGEAAILNMDDGVYYGLDPIGAKIWNFIQKPILIDDVVELILNEYDVEPEHCREDILELIVELMNNGLVEIK
jgi:hypothetical protein